MIDHCVSAFVKSKREEVYKIYMSDALMQMVNVFGHAHGVKENLVVKRFADIIKPPIEITETADEIISRMRAKAKGK